MYITLLLNSQQIQYMSVVTLVGGYIRFSNIMKLSLAEAMKLKLYQIHAILIIIQKNKLYTCIENIHAETIIFATVRESWRVLG